MKLLQATLQTGQTVNFDLPESPNELTFGQAVQLADLEPNDPQHGIKLVSIVTNVPVETWLDTTDTRAFLLLHAECLNLLIAGQKQVVTADSIPYNRKMIIEGKEVTFPEDIGHQSVGQYWDAMTVLQSAYREEKYTYKDEQDKVYLNMKGTLHVFGIIFRLYAQPLTHEAAYNYGEAVRLNIDDCRLNDVLAFAAFFLSSPGSSKSGTPQDQGKAATPRNSLRQVIQRLRRSLGFSSRSTD